MYHCQFLLTLVRNFTFYHSQIHGRRMDFADWNLKDILIDYNQVRIFSDSDAASHVLSKGRIGALVGKHLHCLF